MEKIKVNMSPNPLDVQTIHASQNDGEARQWEFELHNNGELIDTSDVTEQMVFKSYKGGTEELLPSGLLNGSVDLGSFDWSYNEQYQCFITYPVLTDSADVNTTSVPNFESIYKAVSWSVGATDVTQDMIVCFLSSAHQLRIRNKNFTDATAFKESLQGVYLWYEKSESTPTTTPILADIQYPDGLRTDQYFTYRETPTTVSNKARIKTIKGNTLVWNQLVRNGNFADESYWQGNGTKSVSNNEMTYTKPARWNSLSNNQLVNLVSGHKYLVMFETYCENDTMLIFWQTGTGTGGAVYTIPAGTSWKKHSLILTSAQTTASGRVPGFDNNSAQETIFHLRNYMFIDLTMMGLDSMTLDEVKEWLNAYYPLPYYSYNQGSLLSFNGSGIKTVGKNLLETATSGSVSGVTFTVNSDGSITVNGTATSNGTYDFYRSTTALPSWAKVGETYTLSLTNPINRFSIHSYDSSGTVTALVDTSTASKVFTIPNDAVGMLIRVFISSGITYDVTVYPQIEIGTSATSYEPYTSHTTNLPVSTYFPTGMKSAGTVYDELTPTKATTRIGAVDLGTLTFSNNGTITGGQQFITQIPNKAYGQTNIVSAKFIVSTSTNDLWTMRGRDNSNSVAFNVSYATAEEMKTAMNGVYLYYELATPTETSFTTASLVTENAEIPLSAENDVLVGKCTEELSAEPGFIDAKIKLTDGDGTCYSNKLQLHVERKPS